MPLTKMGSALADTAEGAVVQSAPLQTAAPMVPPAMAHPVDPPPVTPPVTPQPRHRYWLWAAGSVLAAGMAGLLFFHPWSAAVSEVAAETVALAPVTRVLAVNGRIAAVQSVDLRPQVIGTLAAVLVAEGDPVQAGVAVARIDPAAQQAVVRQAMAGLDAALVAEADARATFARTKALGTNAARVVLESAARAVETASQEVARMTALQDQAQIQLDRFTIRAPLAGTVLLLNADPGQIVDLETVLMTIADLGQLVVETDVDESYATQIRVGQHAALQLSGETAVRDGRISFVSRLVDENTGGLEVKVTPATPLDAPVGLTVTVNIIVEERTTAITVPRAAIINDVGGDAVLVVTDGVARRRPVTVIAWPAARLIVTEGLAAGDVVITDAAGLADGQAVAVTP